MKSSVGAENGEQVDPLERQVEASGGERPELVRKPLGRFSPKKPMIGRWVGILALFLLYTIMIVVGEEGFAPPSFSGVFD